LPLLVAIGFKLLEIYPVAIPYIIAGTFLFTIYELSIFVLLKKINFSEGTATMLQLAFSGLRFFLVMGLILVPIVTKNPEKKTLLISILSLGIYYIVVGNILQLKTKK
jgi:hypothetical protein